MRRLFNPHLKGFPRIIIPSTRTLNQRLPALKGRSLSLDLIGNRPPNSTDRVHIFNLNLHPKFRLSRRPDADIAVATHLPLFHIRVAHPAINENLLKGGQVGKSLLGRLNIWLTDDFH